MTNRAGGAYGAWCVGYILSDDTESGIRAEAYANNVTTPTPDYVLSITHKIQGFAMVGDCISLSQSYGRKNASNIFLYENVLETEPHTTTALGGKDVPVWFLDSTVESVRFSAPPTSEGLAAYNGKLLILYESAANYYRLNGALNPTDRVWAMTVPDPFKP